MEDFRIAVSNGDYDNVLRFLINYNVDDIGINEVYTDEHGDQTTALIDAIFNNNDIDIIELLIKHSDINAKINDDGFNAIIAAIGQENFDVVELLLNNKKIEIDDNTYRVLFEILENNELWGKIEELHNKYTERRDARENVKLLQLPDYADYLVTSYLFGKSARKKRKSRKSRKSRRKTRKSRKTRRKTRKSRKSRKL